MHLFDDFDGSLAAEDVYREDEYQPHICSLCNHPLVDCYCWEGEMETFQPLDPTDGYNDCGDEGY
jgi:hypothetical protein